MTEKTCVISVELVERRTQPNVVKSLLKSTVPVTVVIVDSTPNDPELASAIPSSPKVKLLRAPDNLGFGRSNNIGIRWALRSTTCDYILLLNNDTVIYPDSIAILQRAMDENPALSISTPRIAYFDNPRQLWYGGGMVSASRKCIYTRLRRKCRSRSRHDSSEMFPLQPVVP